MEAPKSNMARSTLEFPITQGIVNVPGSLHFGGSFLWRTADTFSLILTFSSPRNFFLLVHSSLRNLA